jgi:arylamine N-acetyltransferase
MTPWEGNQPLGSLSDAQLETYLQYVSSGTLSISAVRRALSLPTGRLNVLRTLIRLHTTKVPWGSLSYHYSDKHINSLDLDDVFDKIVRRGLGGHCLEMVPLFAAVLRGLDYELYMTAARISPVMAGNPDGPPGFHGWSHIILILSVDGRKYVVDPQYLEITEPVLLDPLGGEVTFHGIPTTIVRLRYCALSDVVPNSASRSGLKTWLFEYKRSEADTQWMPSYIFSPETEWYLDDLPIMNVWLAKADESYLVTRFVIKRLLLGGPDDPADSLHLAKGVSGSAEDGLVVTPDILGTVQLVEDNLTVFKYGERILDETIKTEAERLLLLKRWFGITLTKEEAAAILHRPTALQH